MRTWLDVLLLLCLGGSSQASIEDVQLAKVHLLWLLSTNSSCQPLVIIASWGGLADSGFGPTCTLGLVISTGGDGTRAAHVEMQHWKCWS